VKGTKEKLGWPVDQTFVVPETVRAMFASAPPRAARRASAGGGDERVRRAPTRRAPRPTRRCSREAVPADLFEELLAAAPQEGPPRRACSAGIVEQRAAALVPSLVGGSADLNPSTKTYIEGSPAVEARRVRGSQRPFRHPRARHGRRS
jgi:transketolase